MSSPFVLQLKNKPCLVIGGGHIAERKIAHLLAEEAAVTVISPTLTEGLKQHADSFTYKATSIHEADLGQNICNRLGLNWKTFFLLVIATDSSSTNEMVAKSLSDFISLINVVDNPEKSSFFFPAVLTRGLLKIAITTSGASPILAKQIKKYLSTIFGPEYCRYVDHLASIRGDLHKREPNPKRRKEILEEVTKLPIPCWFEGKFNDKDPTK